MPLPWAVVGFAIASEFAKSFAIEAGKQAAAQLFAKPDTFNGNCQAAYQSLRELVGEALDQNELSLAMDKVRGLSSALGEWQQTPDLHPQTPEMVLYDLTTMVIPTLIRLSPSSIGVYVQAINCKLTLLSLLPNGKREAIATGLEAAQEIEGHNWFDLVRSEFKKNYPWQARYVEYSLGPEEEAPRAGTRRRP